MSMCQACELCELCSQTLSHHFYDQDVLIGAEVKLDAVPQPLNSSEPALLKTPFKIPLSFITTLPGFKLSEYKVFYFVSDSSEHQIQ